MKIDEFKERLQLLLTENETLQAKADAEKRDFTVEETEKFDANQAAFTAAKENIERLQAHEEQQQLLLKPNGRKTKPEAPAEPAEEGDEKLSPNGNRYKPKTTIRAVEDFSLSKNGGFRSLGDMAWAVAKACSRGGSLDPRLERSERLAAATTYGNEGSGADGGFAVPPDFRNSIMQTILAEDSLLAKCDQVTVDGNQFTCPMDETSPWQTTGGIQATWDGEAVAATQSKPALGERTIKANKIRCLVPMTEESMADASALDSWLRKKAPEKIGHKVDLAIFQGTGVGQPLGVLNSPALVTVSKESSQTADTLIGLNVIKMHMRMYAPCRKNAVWLINPDIEAELLNLSLPGRDAVGNAVTGWGGLLYVPPGGLSASPFGTLLGRPVVPNQVCETLGDKGDIAFIDFTQYLAVLKSGPNPRVETSMHLWFDQDLMAFKFVLRVGGITWWSSTLSARDGSTTYSPYVALEAR
jgi:HK97 family phage major capsid protein